MFAFRMNIKLRCAVRLSNMMLQPSHRSELITQLFLNDRVELLETSDSEWIRVKSHFNETEAWVLRTQFERINEEEFRQAAILISSIRKTIPSFNEIPGTLYFNEEEKPAHAIPLSFIQRDETTILDILHSFLDTPYMWGGMTYAGIDCSGLSQILYRFLGIPLTSFAAEQFAEGEVLDFLQDARCGDLAFFEGDDKVIYHVGILLNSSEIIHATEKAGKVVIDHIDNQGIISKHNGKRTHHLRMIKRLY